MTYSDSPELTIGVLNTSIASENAGDFIIMEAAAREIAQCLPLCYKVHLTTHEKLSRASLRMQKKIAFNVACGTNLLHSHMEIVKQWNIGLLAGRALKPVVLLGVGWRGHASRKTTFFTKFFLRSLLSREYLHSVRDSYSEGRLREIGVANVLNTACPTMWGLTPDHCAEIPAEQGEDVVTTLTDYSPEPNKDRQLLDMLKRLYRRVYFWRQGAGDCEYLASFTRPGEVEILPSTLQAFNELLADRSLSLDYVGTRLHGGIRALQHTAPRVDYRRGPPGARQSGRLPLAGNEPLHAACRDGARHSLARGLRNSNPAGKHPPLARTVRPQLRENTRCSELAAPSLMPHVHQTAH